MQVDAEQIAYLVQLQKIEKKLIQIFGIILSRVKTGPETHAHDFIPFLSSCLSSTFFLKAINIQSTRAVGTRSSFLSSNTNAH